jgi:unconventional prefoldin RPB5 interactor 1
MPDNLSYDVMVPLSKYALMPGKVKNTNEILVLLGENWFVERSAKQANEIVQRRIVGINKFLDDTKKELKLIQDQIDKTDQLLMVLTFLLFFF